MMRVAVIVTFLLASCSPHKPPAPAASVGVARVSVASVKEVRRAVGEESTGTVRAARTATLAPTVMGTVVEVRVAPGDRIRAGDVLVRISAREIDARLAQARAIHAQAKRERDRSVALRDADVIPAAQLDAALAELHVAEAAQAEARTLAEHTLIRAPFAGVVTAKLVEVGDVAMPGRSLLVVEAPELLRFEAMVPESAARVLGLGDTLAVALDGAAAPTSGTIAEIDPTADPASRTVLIKLDLPRGTVARPGMFGRITHPANDRSAVAVPPAALVRRGQLDQVFVVEDQRAHLRLVRLGRERDGLVEVLAGVRRGEQVAMAEASELVDGQPVEVRP